MSLRRFGNFYTSAFAFALLCLGSAISGFAGAAESFFHGMIVSAQTDGKEWATPEMAATLDDLKALGVDSIGIHPYCYIHNDGTLHWDRTSEPDYVVKPLEWARERHLRVMLIPHISYFGTRFLWRGDITFNTPREWNRFFTQYEEWIVHIASLAQEHGVDVFCVGLEYGPSQKFDLRWRGIIASVRKVFHGKLTYGANWNEVENVPYWDALDYIGVLAYFPLTDKPDPSIGQIAQGWGQWMNQLSGLSGKFHKPVLFTEVGYNCSPITASKPWDFHTNGGPEATVVQTRCVEVALDLPRHYPFLAGMFFWKWFPDLPDPEPETFDMRTPAMRSVLAKHWGPALTAKTGSLQNQ